MLIYLKKCFLSINLYLLFFLIWIIKQIDYSFSTLTIYQNFSIILIIIFSFTFVLLILAILNLINKKNFFQYFSVIFLSLFIINLLFDSFSEKTKNIQNEMFYKSLLKDKNSNYKFDFRTKKQVVEDLKKETNSNVYPVTHPKYKINLKDYSYKDIFPLSGISKSTVVFCNESGEYSIYQSDRYGFNNPDINYDNNTKERVMLIGDSFVHGACVDQEDTLSSQLNKVNIPSFSISYGGNGPLLELATLIEYIHVLKPKIVIWFYAENDLPNLVIEKKSKFLMQYLRKNNFTQNLSQRQNEIDLLWKKILNQNLDVVDYLQVTKKKTFLRNFLRKIERAFLLKPMRDFLKFYYEKELIQHYETVHKDHLHLYSEILTKVKEISNNHNSSLYFVYLPFLSSVVENTRTKKEIINIVNQLDIQIIDFHEYLKNENKPESFFPLGKHGHYNDRGYKELSNIISSHLN